MPSRFLILHICNCLPFLLPLTGFWVLHMKLGVTANACSLISCNLQRCLYIFSESNLLNFFHTPSNLLYYPFVLYICNAFTSSLHIHVISCTQFTYFIFKFPASPTHKCINTYLCFIFPGHSGRAKFQWSHREGLREWICCSHLSSGFSLASVSYWLNLTGSQRVKDPIDVSHKVSISQDTRQRGEGGE